jgi:anti-sigma B factor antagonist
MQPEYESELEVHGDIGILAAHGEADLATAGRFRRDLDEAMHIARGDLVLDLTDLDLVDSTALGVMLSALRQMSEQQRSLVVVASGHVLRVLTITGAQTSFRVTGSLPEALTQLAGFHTRRLIL